MTFKTHIESIGRAIGLVAFAFCATLFFPMPSHAHVSDSAAWAVSLFPALAFVMLLFRPGATFVRWLRGIPLSRFAAAADAALAMFFAGFAANLVGGGGSWSGVAFPLVLALALAYLSILKVWSEVKPNVTGGGPSAAPNP